MTDYIDDNFDKNQNDSLQKKYKKINHNFILRFFVYGLLSIFVFTFFTYINFSKIKDFIQEMTPPKNNSFINYPYISHGTPYKKLSNGSVLFSNGIMIPSKNKLIKFQNEVPKGYNFELLNDKILYENGVFDLKTNRLNIFQNNRINRKYMRTNLLNNGNLIYTGGIQNKKLISEVELLDVNTNKFKITGKLKIPRANHYVIHLTNDNILIFGGINTSPNFIRKKYANGDFRYVLDVKNSNEDNYIEEYNPLLNQSTLKEKPKELSLNEYFIQNNNKVLFFHQINNKKFEVSIKLYDCQNNKIKKIETLSSTALRNLKHCFISNDEVYLYFNNKKCYVFNFNKEKLVKVSNNPFLYCICPTMVQLPDKKILILGGDDAGGWNSRILSNAVVYDYKNDEYYKTKNAPIYKLKYPKALLIDDKRVLIETIDGYQVYLI